MLLVDTFVDILYFTVVNRDFDFGQFNCNTLRQRYTEMIETAELRSKEGDIPDSKWRKAFFAVAVWVDEMILLSSFPEKLQWQKESLQRTFFHTANGGIEFYSTLESLTEAENTIREIYDICLSLGFKGAYYRSDDTSVRSQIASNIMQSLKNNHDPKLPKTLFPCAYKGMGELDIYEEKQNRLFLTIALVAVPPLTFVLLYILLQLNLTNMAHIWLQGF